MLRWNPRWIHTSGDFLVTTKVSVLQRSSWRDPPPEWGTCKISNRHWLPDLTHRTSLIFPACSVSEMEESMSIWHFTSASFWQSVTTTAPFNNWDKRISKESSRNLWCTHTARFIPIFAVCDDENDLHKKWWIIIFWQQIDETFLGHSLPTPFGQ